MLSIAQGEEDEDALLTPVRWVGNYSSNTPPPLDIIVSTCKNKGRFQFTVLPLILPEFKNSDQYMLNHSHNYMYM